MKPTKSFHTEPHKSAGDFEDFDKYTAIAGIQYEEFKVLKRNTIWISTFPVVILALAVLGSTISYSDFSAALLMGGLLATGTACIWCIINIYELKGLDIVQKPVKIRWMLINLLPFLYVLLYILFIINIR